VKYSRCQSAHLAGDDIARLFLPLPDFRDEGFASQVMAGDLLGVELALHHDLGRDAGVVGAGDPGRVMAAHAVVAGQAIHDGLVESVPHVQRARHVGRRQLDRKRWLAGVGGGGEISALFPLRTPELFNVGRLERLG